MFFLNVAQQLNKKDSLFLITMDAVHVSKSLETWYLISFTLPVSPTLRNKKASPMLIIIKTVYENSNLPVCNLIKSCF